MTASKTVADSSIKLFDPTIREDLSRLLQYSKAFRFDSELKAQFNFVCVVQDRLHDAINYLDSHLQPPRSDPAFYLFMTYADNVFSAVKEVFKVFKGKVVDPYSDNVIGPESYKYFENVVRNAFPEITKDKMPTDDQFFKYFRALSFAHPYDTSRYKFIRKAEGEKHYSPFVLNNSNPGLSRYCRDAIGIKVYSNLRVPDEFSIIVSYAVLKEYLVSRYASLRNVIDYIQGLVDEKQKLWLKHKADRSLTPLALLEEIRSIYIERYEETYFVDETIRLLKAELSLKSPKNVKNVAIFRKALESVIIPVCDALEKMDYEAAANLIDGFISPDIPDWPERPDTRYRGMDYHYGKVSEYCRNAESSREDYKSIDLSCLMSGFVSEWVDIDPDHMTRDEIWLLVSTAWYLESTECQKSGKLQRAEVTILPTERLLDSILEEGVLSRDK